MKRKLILSLLIFSALASQASGFEAKLKWSRDIEAPLTSNITFHDGKLILGDESGKLHALAASTGAELWEYDGINSVCGTPFIVSNEVFFTHSDGEIVSLNVSGGELLARYLPVDEIDSRLEDGAAYGEGLLFTARTDGKIYAVSADTGDKVWEYQARQGLRTAPAYGDGLVFQGEYDGLFSIIDAKTGERLNGGGAGGAVNTPAVNGGRVYFTAWDGSVQSVQIKDVIPLWNVKLNDPVTTPPVLSGSMILAGTARGYVFALNEADGKTLWQYDTSGGMITARPLAADGLVFVCSTDGVVHVLEAETGKALHRLRVKEGIEKDAAYSDGVFYFGGSRGIIYALQ